MFLGLGGRDRDRNFSVCWPDLELAYKILFLTIIISTVVTLAFPNFALYLPNIVQKVVEDFQLWRLFTSFLMHGAKLTAVLNALFNLYVLYVCLPDIQHKFSTAYVTIQFFIHLLLNNIVLTFVGYTFVYYEILQSKSVTGYGLLPLIFTFMWQRVSQTPQEPTRFCWFPCLIPMKHVPWCYFLFQIAFNNPIAPLVIYCLLGYFEFMVRKKNIALLSLAVYKKFDSIMPDWIINRGGYVKVIKVEEQLRGICEGGSRCCWGNQKESQVGTNQRVEILGDGVAIGGRHVNPQNHEVGKSHWLKKDQQLQIQRIKQQIVEKQAKEQEQPQVQSDIIQQDQNIQGDKSSLLSQNPLMNQSAEVVSKSSSEPQYQFQVRNDE